MDIHAIFEDLSTKLNIKIEPDPSGFYHTRFANFPLLFQIQKNHLSILIKIEGLSEGPYRERVFKAALQANGQPYCTDGVFCYLPTSRSLCLCNYISIEDLSDEILVDLIQRTAYKAKCWREALVQGEVPVPISPSQW